MNTNKVQTLLSTLTYSQKNDFFKKLEQQIEHIQNDIQTSSAQIISATTLSADQKAVIEKEITSKNPKVNKFVYSEDTSLIGGIQIKISDQLYDYSLSKYL